jgi:alcohol dehydrogenase (cytochrome c)
MSASQQHAPGLRQVALALALVVFLLSGCASRYQELPVRTKSEPFTHRDARQPHQAPPVADRVTSQRLVGARSEPHNWLTYYGAYDAQRFSSLAQIDTGNIARLRPAWTFQHPIVTLIASLSTYAFEAAPIVADGVMYVSGFDGYVWALDAVTGRLLWEYQHSIPIDVALCCGNINRGVAVADGKVYLATLNAHLVALDARTGARVWEQAFGDMRAGESATLAPLVVKDLVVVGASGGEFGVRGHLDAFDARTGRRRWRLYTVPKPGEPGSETWPKGAAWATGGGAVWITGSYDPELNLMYWGTSNPGPVFEGQPRSGLNLYTNSVIAVDPDDGSMRWHYQFTPHDVWDYDGVNEMILFDRDGRKLLAHFDKNGHLFLLDRANGALVRVTPFAPVTWGKIDSSTGHVTVLRTPTPGGTEICPGPAGAKEWNHAAYSQQTGLLYVPMIEACATFKTDLTPFKEGMPYHGGHADVGRHEQIGYIKAINPGTGAEVWSWRSEHPMVGSLLTTAGGLVFAGAPTGELLAFAARSGRLLWRYQTGSGIRGNPVTYSVNGTQYVAVPSGWGGWVKGFAPELLGASRGSALFAFALP